MFRTSSQAAIAALVTLPLLGSAPSAFAQEAIMLEQLGAVRMATPVETQRRNGESVETLWFADAKATAYYTLDQDNHAVVARFGAGPKGGNPNLVHLTLSDGAVERIVVDGSGQNRIRATLVVSRHGDELKATVETSKKVDQASVEPASSATTATYPLLPVIGAAFTDSRIATNPDEVRRQGGFATAGAVQWLPVAPAIVEATGVKAVKVGVL